MNRRQVLALAAVALALLATMIAGPWWHRTPAFVVVGLLIAYID